MLTWRFQEQATTQVWTENKQCKHFLYKGTVEKLMCSSPKVALLPSIQHLLQTMLHGMALFYNTKIQNAPPWKLTNVEWFQAIKFAYRECKGKNTTNLPTHETTYLLKYEKATLWHSYKAKKNQGLLCVKRKTIQKTCHLSLMQHAGHREIYKLFIIFRKRDRFLTTWREWNLVIQYCLTWQSI